MNAPWLRVGVTTVSFTLVDTPAFAASGLAAGADGRTSRRQA
jgi:hypothetical protein